MLDPIRVYLFVIINRLFCKKHYFESGVDTFKTLDPDPTQIQGSVYGTEVLTQRGGREPDAHIPAGVEGGVQTAVLVIERPLAPQWKVQN